MSNHWMIRLAGSFRVFAMLIAITGIAAVSAINGQTITFETPTYTLGNINGQDGWMKTGPYDMAVSASGATAGFGAQSLRISNAVTSGSFGDMAFSRPIANEAGETSATNGGLSGGIRKNSYQIQFSLASAVPGAQQPGLTMSIAPDRGDGARMSYLRFEDQADGIHVFFDDYRDLAPFGGANGDDPNGCNAGGDDFFETDIATLNRATPHTIQFVVNFVDGPRNDIVKVYIDGVLEITGTSWEDYFRYCAEQIADNNTHTVDSLIFRTAGTAAPGNIGNGFLIDNMVSGSFSTAASNTTVVVNHSDINNWVLYNDSNVPPEGPDPTCGSFVTGPGTTPFGTGSAQVSVSGQRRCNLATYQFAGTPLSAITTLAFSTYNPSAGNPGPADRSGFLVMNIDFTGNDNFQRRLVYVPRQNGTVIQNTWQEWDAINGGNANWSYSGPTWPAGIGGGGEPGPTLKTWSQILSQYPGIRIRVTDAHVGVRTGEPYLDGYTENIDGFKFGTSTGTTTFDFDPATVQTVTPAITPNAFDNDYTRINNAVQAAPSGSTIILSGTFNWAEANAALSWSRGSDGLTAAGALSDDDYSLLVPANRNGVTITASSPGAATIQGPGDIAAVNLEGVFHFYSTANRPAGLNQNFTISNLAILDFDLPIGMFANGVSDFNDAHIVNNRIRTARDLNATVAPADVNQNIGIHLSFGANQVISGNTIELHGDGISAAPNFSSEVGLQSNTSGGAVYNGLQITNNTVRVLNAQDNANPENLLGIWENSHGHTGNVTVSGNTFENMAVGNNPAVNLQRAFRVTSHSSATTTVTYANNTVSGANIGFQWIAGSTFGANQPVRMTSNTIRNNATGVLVQSQGVATLAFNRIVGNTTAGVSNVDGVVNAENNWWGCNYGPGVTGAGCPGPVNGTTGTVDANPWLVLTTSGIPTTLGLGQSSAITSLLTTNSALTTPLGGSLPGTPAAFAGTLGNVVPTSATTVNGATGTTFTATAFGSGSASTTIDGQTVSVAITITGTCVDVSTPTTLTTLTGTSVIVPINTTDVTGRGAISTDMTITYNASVLTNPIVTIGTVPPGGSGFTVNTSSPGTIVISIFNSNPFVGAGTLANISFTANGLPGTSSPITYSAFKYNEGSPCSTTSNGLVTVISGNITGTVSYGNALGLPAPPRHVPNVALNAAGSIPVNTLTASNGTYTLTGMGSGAYTVTPSKTGDVFGAVSSFDSGQIAQHVVNLTTLNSNQLIVADVSGAGGVSSFDAALIARYVTLLPGSGSTGTWRFLPVNRSYPNVNAGATGQDYDALLMGDVSGNWFDPSATRPAPMIFDLLSKPLMVNVPKMEAQVGGQVEIPIAIQDTTDKAINAYQFELEYDPAVLSPVMENGARVAGTVSDGYVVTVNPTEPGVLRVAAFGALPLQGEGSLINLRFEVIGAVGSSSSLVWRTFGLNEGGIYFKAEDGGIQVVQGKKPTINGRVLTGYGEGVRNAQVTVTDTNGEVRTVRTNASGLFTVSGLRAGQTYTITVTTRGHSFAPQVVAMDDKPVAIDIIEQQ
jgi:hypothetical protein